MFIDIKQGINSNENYIHKIEMSGELPKTQHEKVPLLKNSPDVDTNISQKSDDVNTSISKNSNNDTKLSIKLSKFYDSAQNAEMLGGVTRTTNIINDKDGRNNQTWWTLLKNGVNVDSRKETFCDDLGRKTSSSLYTIERDSSGNLVNSTQNILLNTTYSYIDLPLYKTSGQVFAVNMRNNSGFSKLLTYQYDELGNISKANDVSYVYDEAGQLTRVNDPANGTIVYNYDVGGNITSKVTYAYTEGTLGTPLSTISYGYDTTWRDLLTSYDGNTITYDNIGNPLSYYNGLTFTWQMGRQLAGVSGNGNTISYRYDENGIRTSKTVNGTTTEFTLVGDKITYQTDGTNSLYFRYDGDDKLIGFELNGVDYYYVRNLQDDIIAILDNTGACVVEYTYDAWGKLLTTTGSLAGAVGVINPFRYRGYYYDTETNLYYLQSRYYDANTGRFLNADDTALLLATQGDLLGANLFAYCNNNPVMNDDPTGEFVSVVVGAFFSGFSYWLESKLGMRNWNGWLFAGYVALGATLGAAGAYFRYWASFTNLAAKIANKLYLLKGIKAFPLIKTVITWGSRGITFAINAIAKSFTREPGESWGKFFKRQFGW